MGSLLANWLNICRSYLAFCEPQRATAELEGCIVELIAQAFEFLEVDCFTLSNLWTSIIYHRWQPLCYLSNGHCFRTTQFQTAHWIQYTHDSTHSFSVVVQKLGSFLANWFTYLQVSSCILRASMGHSCIVELTAAGFQLLEMD